MTTKYSVLLLYPDYQNDSGTETYYALVTATDEDHAIIRAQVMAADANNMEGDDDFLGFVPLLLLAGHHPSLSLFNK